VTDPDPVMLTGLCRLVGPVDMVLLGGLCEPSPCVRRREETPASNSSDPPLPVAFSEASTCRIFATTWNTGSCGARGLAAKIPHWIPPPSAGYDLYVVALQECVCPTAMRHAIHKYLGK
jgi:hypothetical protein